MGAKYMIVLNLYHTYYVSLCFLLAFYYGLSSHFIATVILKSSRKKLLCPISRSHSSYMHNLKLPLYSHARLNRALG